MVDYDRSNEAPPNVFILDTSLTIEKNRYGEDVLWHTFNQIELIDRYTDFIYTDRFKVHGDFEMTFVGNDHVSWAMKNLPLMAAISHDKTDTFCFVEKRELSASDSFGVPTLKISGRESRAQLKYRTSWELGLGSVFELSPIQKSNEYLWPPGFTWNGAAVGGRFIEPGVVTNYWSFDNQPQDYTPRQPTDSHTNRYAEPNTSFAYGSRYMEGMVSSALYRIRGGYFSSIDDPQVWPGSQLASLHTLDRDYDQPYYTDLSRSDNFKYPIFADNVYDDIMRFMDLWDVALKIVKPYYRRAERYRYHVNNPRDIGLEFEFAFRKDRPNVTLGPELYTLHSGSYLESCIDEYTHVFSNGRYGSYKRANNLSKTDLKTGFSHRVKYMDLTSVSCTLESRANVPSGSGYTDGQKFDDNIREDYQEEYLEAINAKMDLALQEPENRRVLQFDGVVSPNNQYMYGKDYDLGDTIYLYEPLGPGIRLPDYAYYIDTSLAGDPDSPYIPASVTEYIWSHDASGYREYPSFGTF